MSQEFEKSIFYGSIVNGNLKQAIEYLSHFPEQADLCRKYISLFWEECYLTYGLDAELEEILLIYQKYYRDAFYLELSAEEASRRLRDRLAQLLGADPDSPLDALEESAAEAFRRKSFHILTGRTGGYYGPYIWKTEVLQHYTVELPEGTRDYSVKLLDDFVSESWIDYISFGAVGTGGWSDDDGLIHCVRSAYDLGTEVFQASLLKHEAQHAADLAKYKGISPEELEYRAKLVELIYSVQRRLLDQFTYEANAEGTSHGIAAERILKGFEERLHMDRAGLAGLPIAEVQAVSRALFAESGRELADKYC